MFRFKFHAKAPSLANTVNCELIMPVYELKNCERCGKRFECTVGNISNCQCNELALTAEERAYVESLYEDCLCVDCLQKVKQEYPLFKEKFIYGGKR